MVIVAIEQKSSVRLRGDLGSFPPRRNSQIRVQLCLLTSTDCQRPQPRHWFYRLGVLPSSPMLPLGQSVLRLASALAIGLLIGAERERRKGEGPQRSAAGVRTFTLASLCARSWVQSQFQSQGNHCLCIFSSTRELV